MSSSAIPMTPGEEVGLVVVAYGVVGFLVFMHRAVDLKKSGAPALVWPLLLVIALVRAALAPVWRWKRTHIGEAARVDREVRRIENERKLLAAKRDLERERLAYERDLDRYISEGIDR